MDSNDINDVKNMAKYNYKKSEPWPDDDVWHSYTYKILHKHIQDYIDELQFKNTQIVLNAGCGKTTYKTCANIIYMDIIEEYINLFEDYIIGSIEDIPLQDCSVDCVICVGSVINYVDIQKAMSEFSRVLKPNGILLLEFERSNSAEFLFTKKYAKTVFMQTYQYNNQTHYLWMYNEKFVLQLAEFYKFSCNKIYRFHSISSLLFRFGISEKKAAKYSKLDNWLQFLSAFFAHNEILILEKNVLL
jgi:SAM-dependent methyltransferase